MAINRIFRIPVLNRTTKLFAKFGELAGHASIDTTSIHSTQELARKIKAVQGMKKRVWDRLRNLT